MNKIQLIGRLTKDPELRYTNNQKAYATYGLAVNRRFAKEGEQQADFLNIVAWGKTAEFCKNYFKKGQQIGLSGRVQTRNYEDNSGKKVYITEVIAEEVYFVGNNNTNNNTNNTNKTNNNEQEEIDFEQLAKEMQFD